MADARQYDDGSRILTFRRTDAECVALEAHYPGIRFNQVQLLFLSRSAQRDAPERDDIDTLFNVSGSGMHLVRHGFALESWWAGLPASGISHNCETLAFGRAWQIARTRSGFRLQGARYEDSLSKLALALRPYTPQARSATTPPTLSRP